MTDKPHVLIQHPAVRLVGQLEYAWSHDQRQADARASIVVKALIEAKLLQGYVQSGMPCEYPRDVLEANRPPEREVPL